MNYTITNDSLTVILDGKCHNISKTHANFAVIRSACINEDEELLRKHITILHSRKTFLNGIFVLEGDKITFTGTGEPVPAGLAAQMVKTFKEGKSPERFMHFWQKVQENPSHRSVHQLWSFLQHADIQIDDQGFILAYKGVRHNFMDKHSGTVDNRVGTSVSMPRNKISDDPKEACHVGLHVGAIGYAQSFGERVVQCRVHPRDVVCIPYDSSAMKMRCCAYEVTGLANNYSFNSTTSSYEEDMDDSVDEEDDLDELEDEEYDEEVVNKDEVLVKKPVRQDLGSIDMALLSTMKIDDLRKEAKKFGVVNANKIPGGKLALLDAIAHSLINQKKP
jgi:hypothetical protein